MVVSFLRWLAHLRPAGGVFREFHLLTSTYVRIWLKEKGVTHCCLHLAVQSVKQEGSTISVFCCLTEVRAAFTYAALISAVDPVVPKHDQWMSMDEWGIARLSMGPMGEVSSIAQGVDQPDHISLSCQRPKDFMIKSAFPQKPKVRQLWRLMHTCKWTLY